mgnify:FL=1
MDAVEFLKTLHRMCDRHCTNCEFGKRLCGFVTSCTVWIETHPEEAVAISKQWAKEHPAQTRQSEFLKLFPGVDADKTDGCLTLNPCIIYPKMREECSGKLCHECKKTFWLAEVEDNG